jgi:hypothetical protein
LPKTENACIDHSQATTIGFERKSAISILDDSAPEFQQDINIFSELASSNCLMAEIDK